MEHERYYYTWKDFERDCVKITEWAEDKGFKNIYGIPRGELPLAVKLSHLLELPQILSKEDITRDTLIVDDIIDTWATLDRLLAQVGSKIKVASLYILVQSQK